MPQAHDRPAAHEMTPGPTFGEMLDEGLGLVAGLTTMLLPLFLTAVPGVVLLLVAPAVLVLAVVALPVMVAGAILAPPYLVVRAIRGRRHAR
jgi:Flp pilus assembly protein TadB